MTPICKDPNKLCPCIRSRYLDLMALCKERDLGVLLLETLRARDRQEYYIRTGVSWTRRSLHLPQSPRFLSLAFDLAIKDYLKEKLWNPGGPLWRVLASEGERVGLSHGVIRNNRDIDPGHFYLPRCECQGQPQPPTPPALPV